MDIGYLFYTFYKFLRQIIDWVTEFFNNRKRNMETDIKINSVSTLTNEEKEKIASMRIKKFDKKQTGAQKIKKSDRNISERMDKKHLEIINGWLN